MTAYLVRYPSGTVFTVDGRLAVITAPHGPVPAVGRGTDVVALDPRAIITAGGTRVYGPRNLVPGEHDPGVLAWLLDHPGWDPVDSRRTNGTASEGTTP